MTPNDMIKELATELQSVIRELDETHLKQNPEEEFVDLAARLVLKLKQKAITIVPVPSTAQQMDASRGDAASRIFDIFTTWLRKHPECSYVTEISLSGKFGIVVRTPGEKPRAFFQGETVQDAYAQAAQTFAFDEELL
jgi:hypothetical protein